MKVLMFFLLLQAPYMYIDCTNNHLINLMQKILIEISAHFFAASCTINQ